MVNLLAWSSGVKGEVKLLEERAIDYILHEILGEKQALEKPTYYSHQTKAIFSEVSISRSD
jgi:hypothetical protein